MLRIRQLIKWLAKEKRTKLVRVLSASDKFFIGYWEDIWAIELFKNEEKLKVSEFSKVYGPYLKLPFQSCWFECNGVDEPETRRGLLVNDLSGSTYADSRMKWGFEVLEFISKDGTLWKDNPLIAHFGFDSDDKVIMKFSTNSLSENQLKESSERIRELQERLNVAAQVVLRILILLNCSNSICVDAPLPKRKRKRSKKPKEFFTYKVLQITKPDITHRYPPSPPTEGNKRQHKVRGYIRIYSKERPMFGRYSGPVFIPSHKRGNPNLGSVAKSYKL